MVGQVGYVELIVPESDIICFKGHTIPHMSMIAVLSTVLLGRNTC